MFNDLRGKLASHAPNDDDERSICHGARCGALRRLVSTSPKMSAWLSTADDPARVSFCLLMTHSRHCHPDDSLGSIIGSYRTSER